MPDVTPPPRLSDSDQNLLDAAYEQALKSLRTGGIPIGTQCTHDNEVALCELHARWLGFKLSANHIEEDIQFALDAR